MYLHSEEAKIPLFQLSNYKTKLKLQKRDKAAHVQVGLTYVPVKMLSIKLSIIFFSPFFTFPFLQKHS